MIRLTVARYYTPTGRLIQKPYDDDFTGYARDLSDRMKNGEYFSADKIQFPDSLRYSTLINSRSVFGGGGIMPDVFIPLDTTNYTEFYRDIVRKGTFNMFVLNYMDQNREQLKAAYPGFPKFRNSFEMTTDIFNQLIEYAKKDGIEPTSDELDKSRELISVQIKGLIARDLWDTSEYFEIVNESDETFKTAVKIISNQNLFDQYILKQ
jgi:carboxyl-terminal processing protease